MKYILVEQELITDDASRYCQSTYGTYLASIHNSSDNHEASTLCKMTPSCVTSTCANLLISCHIGLNDKNTGHWIWEDGSTQLYQNWIKGEPRDGNDEHCVVIFPTEHPVIAYRSYWADIECQLHSLYFLCNAPPTESPALNATPELVPNSKESYPHPTINPTHAPTIASTTSMITMNYTMFSTLFTSSPSNAEASPYWGTTKGWMIFGGGCVVLWLVVCVCWCIYTKRTQTNVDVKVPRKPPKLSAITTHSSSNYEQKEENIMHHDEIVPMKLRKKMPMPLRPIVDVDEDQDTHDEHIKPSVPRTTTNSKYSDMYGSPKGNLNHTLCLAEKTIVSVCEPQINQITQRERQRVRSWMRDEVKLKKPYEQIDVSGNTYINSSRRRTAIL